jgi:predicted secreted hydrolase
VRNVDFDRDEFAHPRSPFEWWYFSAFLEDEASHERIHYVSAFMRWHFVWVSYMRWHGQLEPLSYLGLPESAPSDALVLGDNSRPDWSIRLNRVGFSQHRVGASVSLSFRPGASGPALHTPRAAGGIRSYGGDNEMAWYSRPSLEVVGRVLQADGSQTFVTGSGWFEHQWGNTDFRQLIWRYVPLLLDDGQRAIAFSYEHEDFPGERTTEVALLRDGEAQPLIGTTLVPLGPGSLTTRIDGPDTQLEVVSAAGAVDLGLPLVPVFFEGESSVSGTFLGLPATGRAITEYQPV